MLARSTAQRNTERATLRFTLRPPFSCPALFNIQFLFITFVDFHSAGAPDVWALSLLGLFGEGLSLDICLSRISHLFFVITRLRPPPPIPPLGVHESRPEVHALSRLSFFLLSMAFFAVGIYAISFPCPSNLSTFDGLAFYMKTIPFNFAFERGIFLSLGHQTRHFFEGFFLITVKALPSKVTNLFTQTPFSSPCVPHAPTFCLTYRKCNPPLGGVVI